MSHEILMLMYTWTPDLIVHDNTCTGGGCVKPETDDGTENELENTEDGESGQVLHVLFRHVEYSITQWELNACMYM